MHRGNVHGRKSKLKILQEKCIEGNIMGKNPRNSILVSPVAQVRIGILRVLLAVVIGCEHFEGVTRKRFLYSHALT